MILRDSYTCPLELTHDMLKGKWKCIIIWRLRLGATSPSRLRQDIEGITEKMLLQHLKELIQYDIVNKTIYDTLPLKTEYYLTENGQNILKALEIFQKVGIDYMIKIGKKDVLRAKNII